MKDLVIDNENKTYKAILFCMDNDNETRYTTIVLDSKRKTLEINFTHFNSLLEDANIDCSFTFKEKETKKFIKLFAKNETDFIKTIKEKYSNLNAHMELITLAKQNNIKYKLIVYNKDNPNYCRYDFGKIGDDTPMLYYKNGELIVPGFYEHCENGTTGIYTRDGFLYMKLPYKNGKLNGKAKCYYDKTKLVMWENNYVDDKLNGKNFSYFRNGKIERFDTFVVGVKDGLDRTYNEDGILIKEEIWKQNDKINVKIFSNDGKPKQETNYKNGKKEGIERFYDENGCLEEESNYLNNKIDGLCKKYYPNGQVRHEAYFKNGLQKGKAIYYHDNGKIEQTTKFKNNKIVDGTYKAYYKDGKLKRIFTVKDDMLEGYDTCYYPNGQIKLTVPYHCDKEEGTVFKYHGNGNIKYEYNYTHGKLNGICKTYYKNGNIRSSIEYKNGLRDGFSIFYTKETSDVALKMLFINGKLIDLFYVDGVDGYLDKEGTTNFFRELNKLSKVDKKAKQDFPFYEDLKDFINDYI